MAVKYPAFRKKFPLLVTGGLLALQPVAAPFVFAAEQFACQPDASGGWNCASNAASPALPPRPAHSGSAVSTAASAKPGTAQAQQPTATTKLVTESKGRALASRSADYSHLDWVPRDQLTPAQLAETGPYCAGTYVEPDRPGKFDTTPMSEAPTYVSAKATRYEQEQEIATLAGDVVLRQGSIQVEADEASLHQLENRGELTGNV
ncbi:MAG TPA: LPS biosynthesis protein, partial [Pseudomonas sp.]|nr:LPS biosynthesis protein [Pseudomonas sp.]